MNPGKRRKLQKIEFIKKMIEENIKKLELSLKTEVVKNVVEEPKEIVQEELKLEENVISETIKRKKKTS